MEHKQGKGEMVCMLEIRTSRGCRFMFKHQEKNWLPLEGSTIEILAVGVAAMMDLDENEANG